MSPLEILRRMRLKATPKRLAILEILSQEMIYLSPEEVWEKMKQRFTKIGLPTVYRNLEDLSRGDVIIKIVHPDRKLYYFYCKNWMDHHHHFICMSCKKVEDIQFCGIHQIEKEVATGLQGRVVSHLLQVYGLCRGCRNG